MSTRDLVAAALLAVAVLGVLVVCVGAWRAATPLDGQHFVSAAGTVPPLLLAAAVIVRSGWGVRVIFTLIAVGAVLVTGAATTTAFARAVSDQLGPEQTVDEPDGSES